MVNRMEDFGADPAFVPAASSQQVVSTKGFNPGEVDPWFTLAELREAYDELNGCSIRRPGDTCEVRKEFLAVALYVLSDAISDTIATQPSEKQP